MSSGRYQSQFFNFLNRQKLRVMDQTATLLRHAKVAAIWGTQIVLYPVYAIFQTTRLAGRQLGQAVQRSLIRLQLKQANEAVDSANLLRSDFPVQNVLRSVKQALLSGGEISHSSPRSALVWIGRLLPFARSSNLAPSNPYNIQGIASLVDTHGLVLILEGNVIFDTLNDDQKRQIEQRIIFELARYWRWKRKLYLNPAPLGLPEDRETVIPPVRVFRQLMAWIQASPVAIATNLFNETELALPSSGELEWFSPTVPLSAWNPANLAPKKLPTKKDLNKWAGQLPQWDDLESLVWAAIHYFFGGSRKLAAQADFSTDSSPWLSAADVFGGTQPQRFTRELNSVSETVPSLPSSLSESPKTSLKFGRSMRQMIQGFLKELSTAIVIRREETEVIEEVLVMREIRLVTTTIEEPPVVSEPQPSVVRKQRLEKTAEPLSLEAGEDWIETSATDIEYVRSSWEKFLDWLDTGMLWLEQHFILFWRWLTHSQR